MRMKPLNQTSFVVSQLWAARPLCEHRLQVLSGRAWVTLSGDMDKDNPDHVLFSGDSLQVAAGQHLVVEAWPRHRADVLKLSWLTSDKSEGGVKTTSVSSPAA
jgi:hypothetical protein